MLDRCRACVAVHGRHAEVSPDSDLDSHEIEGCPYFWFCVHNSTKKNKCFLFSVLNGALSCLF